MLSVSRPMTAGEGARYFKADDYYLSEKGRWQGRGAEALGLFGEVRHEDFALALRGLHPSTGETLVAGKGERHIAGLDLTFSAPKSVSLLALADPGVKAAHDRAVGRVLAYLETHNVQAREQVDGERRAVSTGNLVVAAFDHLTSRELDAQLHTHAVVLNLTQREGGAWRAVHNVTLYRDQLALGRLYRAELARNLGEAGYAIRVTDRMQGFFEVRGVPEGLLEAFSQRRQQVEERVQELQRSGEYPHASRARLYEIAALGSRAPKDRGVTKEALAESWRAELREHGWNIEDLKREARREGARAREEREKPADRAPAAWEILRTAVQAKTETESVFRKSEVLDIAARLSLGRFSLDEMEDAFRDLERSRFLLTLGEHVADAKGTTVEVHTTREMRNLERRVLDHVNASRGGWTPLVGAPAVTAHIAAREKAQGWTYTKGQKEAIRVLLTSRDGVNLVQGDAGTGKTASLAVVREVAERNGVQVLGLGFTGKAARELQDGAGIPSLTLDSFLKAEVRLVEPGEGRGRAEIERGELTLERGSLLVVDEASMAGSRHFGELLRLARDGGLKLAIVGDRKQFPSIAAGRTLAILQDRARVDQVQMTEVLRQTTEPMKALVQAASRGDQGRVFKMLDASGSLHEIRTKDERIGAVVGDYLERTGEGKRTLILTATNRDRQAINDRVREALQARGRLKGGRPFSVVEPVSLAPEHAVRAEAYRPGQVLLLTGALGEGLPAGRRVEVLSADPERNLLTVKAGTRTAAIDPAADHGKLSVYARVEREFAVGDRIVFRKNDRRLGVQNGLTATVTGIDDRGRFDVQLDRGGRLHFLVDDPGGTRSRRSSARYDAIDHAYALTEYKSQGATVDRVLWHADTTRGRITRNAFYVAATRAREGFTVYTDDKEALKERIGVPQEKTSTLDHAPPGRDEKPRRRERDADRQPSGGRDGRTRGGRTGRQGARAGPQLGAQPVAVTMDRGNAILTPAEVAEELSLRIETVRSLMRRGLLPARKIGGSWRTTRRALYGYLEDQMGLESGCHGAGGKVSGERVLPLQGRSQAVGQGRKGQEEEPRKIFFPR